MVTQTFSSTVDGINGMVTQIECLVQRSTPKIIITGLVGDVVRESRERISACLQGLGYDVPSSKVLVHLMPASSKKQGSHLDLAIAMAILAGEGLIAQKSVQSRAFLGELTLDGQLQKIHPVIPLIQILESDPRIKIIFIPEGHENEINLLQCKKICVVKSVQQTLDLVRGESSTQIPIYQPGKLNLDDPHENICPTSLDSIQGQELAKRALQIALAGNHHLLMVGPPGVGKSFLASAVPGLLSPLHDFESIEVNKIHTLFDKLSTKLNLIRPFRTPHHTISSQALLGGGSGQIIPGEVSLAHHGVLFLDEFPEFRRDAIEGLREPLQSGEIHIHRSHARILLPANFLLIAAMNPCPCGHATNIARRCRCSFDEISKYQKRVSDPILDRIDLYVHMEAQPKASHKTQLSHATVRDSIQMVKNKLKGTTPKSLSTMTDELGLEAKNYISEKSIQLALSFRALTKWLRVAKTIALLDQKSNGAVGINHLQEGLLLRYQSRATQ